MPGGKLFLFVPGSYFLSLHFFGKRPPYKFTQPNDPKMRFLKLLLKIHFKESQPFFFLAIRF